MASRELRFVMQNSWRSGSTEHTSHFRDFSGSGKTHAATHLVRYLLFAGEGKQISLDSSVEDLKLLAQYRSLMLASTTVMEAFGNAKTAKNDNSSRFAKHIIVSIARRGQ